MGLCVCLTLSGEQPTGGPSSSLFAGAPTADGSHTLHDLFVAFPKLEHQQPSLLRRSAGFSLVLSCSTVMAAKSNSDDELNGDRCFGGGDGSRFWSHSFQRRRKWSRVSGSRIQMPVREIDT
ncbi:hypothetical protein LXL04_035380 [Taraxacum kok-saghyz]